MSDHLSSLSSALAITSGSVMVALNKVSYLRWSHLEGLDKLAQVTSEGSLADCLASLALA